MLTNVPVVPTAFGTVMFRKNVARLVAATSAAIRSVRTFSMIWMPLSVRSKMHWESNAVFARDHLDGPGIGSYEDDLLVGSHCAADTPMPGSDLL